MAEIGRRARKRTLLPALALLAAPVFAFPGGQEQAERRRAPRRPPEPFLVFVEASDPVDARLKALIEQALPTVRDRVERRRHWFELAESPETADITLRVINYRSEHRSDTNWEAFFAPILEIHYVDAVAFAGDARGTLSGLDTRPLGQGASLRNAAGQLAEELERFCRENYGALAAAGERAAPREPQDAGPPRLRSVAGHPAGSGR